jgi:hypothetical protein
MPIQTLILLQKGFKLFAVLWQLYKGVGKDGMPLLWSIDALAGTGFPTKRSTRHDSGLCTNSANTIPSQLEQNRFFLCLKQKFDCRAQKFAVDREGGGGIEQRGISLLEKAHLFPLKLTEKKDFYRPQH